MNLEKTIESHIIPKAARTPRGLFFKLWFRSPRVKGCHVWLVFRKGNLHMRVLKAMMASRPWIRTPNRSVRAPPSQPWGFALMISDMLVTSKTSLSKNLLSKKSLLCKTMATRLETTAGTKGAKRPRPALISTDKRQYCTSGVGLRAFYRFQFVRRRSKSAPLKRFLSMFVRGKHRNVKFEPESQLPVNTLHNKTHESGVRATNAW